MSTSRPLSHQVLRGLFRIVVAVSLIAAAATGAVLALFTEPVFWLLGFHPIALDYLHGRISRAELEQVVILGKTFGRSQIDHLDDVGALLGELLWIFLASAAIISAAMILARRMARPAAGLAIGSLAMAVLVVVASYLAFGFQTVGILFHQIVFPQGNWAFPWESLIITLYGTEVMVRGAVFVIGLGLFLLFAAYFIIRRTIPRSPPAVPDQK